MVSMEISQQTHFLELAMRIHLIKDGNCVIFIHNITNFLFLEIKITLNTYDMFFLNIDQGLPKTVKTIRFNLNNLLEQSQGF